MKIKNMFDGTTSVGKERIAGAFAALVVHWLEDAGGSGTVMRIASRVSWPLSPVSDVDVGVEVLKVEDLLDEVISFAKELGGMPRRTVKMLGIDGCESLPARRPFETFWYDGRWGVVQRVLAEAIGNEVFSSPEWAEWVLERKRLKKVAEVMES